MDEPSFLQPPQLGTAFKELVVESGVWVRCTIIDEVQHVETAIGGFPEKVFVLDYAAKRCSGESSDVLF